MGQLSVLESSLACHHLRSSLMVFFRSVGHERFPSAHCKHALEPCEVSTALRQ